MPGMFYLGDVFQLIEDIGTSPDALSFGQPGFISGEVPYPVLTLNKYRNRSTAALVQLSVQKSSEVNFLRS